MAVSPKISWWGRTPHYLIPGIIFLLVFMRPTLSEHQPYRTAYGCEGATLSISCDPGHVINVIRANYGRFSITICNPDGNTEWSVNCQSPKTHRVLIERCSGKPTCEVGVSSIIFGDPCPGTVKYIELHYTCGIAVTTSTTTRPRPPWFVENRPPIWKPPVINASTVAPPIPSLPERLFTTTLASTSTSTTTTPVPTTSSEATTSTTTAQIILKQTVHPDIDGSKDIKSEIHRFTNNIETYSISTVPTRLPSFPVHTTRRSRRPLGPITPPAFTNRDGDMTPWCAPTFTRGLYWNWTKAGEVAILSCPGGASGSARRKCKFGEWEGPADLSECRSAWLNNLETRANGNDGVLGVSTDLAKVTSSKALYGGDLITAARLIKTLSRRMLQDTALYPLSQQRQAVVTEFLLAALETGSALLSAGLAGPWGDLSVGERRTAVTELMIGLEEATFLLASVLPTSGEAAHFKSHVLASARAVSADGSSVNFPSQEDNLLDWVFTEYVSISPEAVIENSEGRATRVIFLTFRHLEDLLSPSNEKLGDSRKNVSRIVNSRIVSASLGHGRHIQLPEPVILTFTLLRHDNVSNPVCVFWDYTTYAWSDEGCYTLTNNRTHVTCKCDHLTNFAVIMEEGSPSESYLQVSPVRILAYIGCAISLVCLFCCVIVISIFKTLPSPKSYLQKHICVCLLIAEISFIVGMWRTDLPIMCGIIAGLLHYSVLAAFVWTFIEGILIYICIAEKTDAESVSLRWWHYLIAYCGPLIVVCSAAIADPFSFGTSEHCWLRSDNYFAAILVVPVFILVVFQTLLIAIALIRSCRLDPEESLKAKEIAKLSSARSWLRNSSTLLLFLVLTWSFGFLLLHQPTILVATGFCVFNSLYGFGILLCHCGREHKVRDWCRSSEQEPNTWIPQFLRSVFSTEKQTYSPNHPHVSSSSASQESNNTATRDSSSHHQAITQYLPALCQLRGLKGSGMHPSRPQTASLLSTGRGSLMGSRGSMRGCVAATLPIGTIPQSPQHLHRGVNPSSTATNSTTITLATALDKVNLSTSLNAPTQDENSSYKSFSRDSGHGGSEQEDSPRTPWNNRHQYYQRYVNSDKNFSERMNTMGHTVENQLLGPYIEGDRRLATLPNSYCMAYAQNQPTIPSLAMLRASGARSHSPWNHTYMEIGNEGDPVYEEIERERWIRTGIPGSEVMQVSDLSDEDMKRGTSSDVSRQSSRSYSDSKPLLPFQQQMKHCKETQFALSEERLKDFNAAQMSLDLQHLQQVRKNFGRDNLMTVAVLNGEQVVCRLSPSEDNSQGLPIIHETNTNLALSPNTNGYPAQVVVSRPHYISSNQYNEC